jgi:hypothetical protein
MRAELEEEAWILDEIGDVEWLMLSQLPDAADFSRSEKGRRRLLPDPIDEADAAADWREYVQPELEGRFRDEVRVVGADLGRAEESERKGKGGAILHRLRVPAEHTEIWYRVLNQARLVLNEEHGIAARERSLVLGEASPSSIDEETWLLLVQYRIYGAIQEFLLTHLMGDA